MQESRTTIEQFLTWLVGGVYGWQRHMGLF
jgi:hypothetical protein